MRVAICQLINSSPLRQHKNLRFASITQKTGPVPVSARCFNCQAFTFSNKRFRCWLVELRHAIAFVVVTIAISLDLLLIIALVTTLRLLWCTYTSSLMALCRRKPWRVNAKFSLRKSSKNLNESMRRKKHSITHLDTMLAAAHNGTISGKKTIKTSMEV